MIVQTIELCYIENHVIMVRTAEILSLTSAFNDRSGEE